MSFDHHFYCFYYCSKLRKFVNLNVLTNLAVTVGIINQTATETLFTVVKDNCLSWCNGALWLRKVTSALSPLTCTVTLESG